MAITGASRKITGLFYDKGGAVVNVMHPDFGAKGDGATDDAAAIQAAVDSGASAVLFPLPPISYLIGSTITITNPGIRLISDAGATIKPNAASFNLFTLASTAHRTKFHGLTFNGAAADDSTTQFGVFSNTSPDDCEVSRCFFGALSDTVSSLNDGIKITGGNRWKVHDNTFSYLKGAISGTGYGVLCGGTNEGIFHSNHFLGSVGHGRHAVYLSDGCTYCKVTNNVCDSFNSVNYPCFSMTGQPSNVGNTIQNNTAKGGGDSTNSSGYAIGVVGAGSSNVLSNNKIDGYQGYGIYISELLTGETNDGNVVDGNDIRNVLRQGILIEGVTNTKVTNNKIRDCGAALPAIQVQKSGSVVSDKTTIIGNSCRGASIRCGLSIQSADNTNTVAIGNDFSEGTVGKIILVAASTPLVALNNHVGLAEFSGNIGDANTTATVSALSENIRYATNLTANRTVTLSTTNAYTGAKFRVIRTGLGAFTLDVGGLKTIPASTAAFVDVEYDGVAATWRLTGYGTL